MREHATKYRVAIVSISPIFHDCAGNAEYLAAFCKSLRALGSRVELFILHPETQGKYLTHFHSQYLASLDAIYLRNHLRIDTKFLTLSPPYWARMLARSIIRPFRPNSTTERMWGFTLPSRRSLIWVGRQLERFQPNFVVANYFNASAAFAHAPTSAKKGIFVHDVLALRQQSFQSAGKKLDFNPQYIEDEARAFREADLCLAITDEERSFIEKHNPGTRTEVFPYVTTIHTSAHQLDTEPTCLFVGSDNTPNRHGLQWFLKEVWPLVLAENSQIRIRIVGTVPLAATNPLPMNVDHIGPVTDLNVEYMKAKVALVPLIAGSGLKIKLVEALAHGVPVVATTCGSAGVAAASTDSLRVHDQAKDFARAIVEIVQNRDWLKLRETALEYAQRHFSEAVAANRLRQVLTELIQ